jgi:hypothetical protein
VGLYQNEKFLIQFHFIFLYLNKRFTIIEEFGIISGTKFYIFSVKKFNTADSLPAFNHVEKLILDISNLKFWKLPKTVQTTSLFPKTQNF